MINFKKIVIQIKSKAGRLAQTLRTTAKKLKPTAEKINAKLVCSVQKFRLTAEKIKNRLTGLAQKLKPLWRKAVDKGCWFWSAILCGVIILSLATIATVNLRNYFQDDITISASGRHDLSFDVFYLENRVFAENPIPRNLEFLMSYTDFIEVRSGFSANLGQETDIYYSYVAEKRMVIRPIGGADIHRQVFEESFPLSQASGHVVSDRIHFDAENDGTPGGTYAIFPKEHIAFYFKFVEDQANQMVAEGVIAQGFRGFTAELMVNFTYTISAPELGLNESVTYGYRLSLTTEVYTFVTMGESNFDWQRVTAVHDITITLPTIVMFVLGVSLALFGLSYSIKKLNEHEDGNRQEHRDILKKYSNEIIIYDEPLNREKYEMKNVQDFGELLKLAIYLNKHIMCYTDDSRAEFAVVVDEYVCLYELNFKN